MKKRMKILIYLYLKRVKRKLKLLCANPDIWVQRGNDLIPCAGAISKKYESIGGEVINIGKPFKPIFDEAIKNIEILGKGKCTSTIVIGDGIDTDIKGQMIIN